MEFSCFHLFLLYSIMGKVEIIHVKCLIMDVINFQFTKYMNFFFILQFLCFPYKGYMGNSVYPHSCMSLCLYRSATHWWPPKEHHILWTSGSLAFIVSLDILQNFLWNSFYFKTRMNCFLYLFWRLKDCFQSEVMSKKVMNFHYVGRIVWKAVGLNVS